MRPSSGCCRRPPEEGRQNVFPHYPHPALGTPSLPVLPQLARWLRLQFPGAARLLADSLDAKCPRQLSVDLLSSLAPCLQ
eukprot:16006383-Heterocapsa_arctica.AAC.1